MTFREQAEKYMAEFASDARQNTLRTYRTRLNSILSIIGEVPMPEVDNKTAKLLAGRLAEANQAPATIRLAVTLVKQIVKSARDERGNPLYPVQWDAAYIKAPEVVKADQKAPIAPIAAIQTAVGALNGEVKALVALLASSGLRINEARAIGLGNVWDPETATVTICGTMVEGDFQPAPKTHAGKRVVDLPVEVNNLLKAETTGGVLFPMSEDTYRRKIDALGIPGFHSLRRFRITHLRLETEAPEPVIKYWSGHAAEGMTEQYTKVKSQVEVRKSWSERAGMGFELNGRI